MPPIGREVLWIGEQVMRILQKVTSLAIRIITHRGRKRTVSGENVEAGKREKDEASQQASLRKCYRCDGTGSVEGGFPGRQAPLRSMKLLRPMTSSGSNPFQVCPVCNGTGCIEY